MSSKGRTELQISLSGAKNAEEVAGDVQKFVAPQKTGENTKKQIFFRKILRKKIFGVEKRNVGDRLKRVFAKFGGCTGQVFRPHFAKTSRKFRQNSRIACFISISF